tara:strand:+ start:394 stop:747 length:354 start_codon:yes stop_codon:yes gene_type:complete
MSAIRQNETVMMTRKPGDIGGVLDDLKNNYFGWEEVKVVKEIAMSNEKFNDYVSDFFADDEERLECIGGQVNGVTQVVRVYNMENNCSVYINTEGYEYARYVGLDTATLYYFENYGI